MGSAAMTSNIFEDILSERRKSNDFGWASRQFTPAPYFVRGRPKDAKGLCNTVLSCERVQEAIQNVARQEGKDEKEIFKRAYDILQEMSHDYHLYVVRWFGYTLSKLSKRHYSSIFVNSSKINQIKECFQRYPVILLPTHRSYVDFLLLSYVCFTYELPLPIIAAGMDFMGMMGVAELLRKAGAFFIRRRFGNDSLYWALISEYVKKAVLQGSHPLEMFVEGTRSRSGKSLYPKIGLLTAILDLVRQREIPDILILPISISYDRTLEESLYARELLGQPKPKESTNGLLKGLKWLGSQSYGSMYVNFGEFISVREKLESEVPRLLDDTQFSNQVQDIALQVILDHQKHIALPLFSAASVIILSKLCKKEDSISFPLMMRFIHGFRALITCRGSDFGQPLSGETLEGNLRYILSIHSSLVVCPKNEEHLVKFRVGEDEVVDCMKFQHYANQFLPTIISYCIFAVIGKSSNSPDALYDENSIEPEYTFMRQLMFDDFLYDKGSEKEEIARTAQILNSYLRKGRTNGHTQQWNSETDELISIFKSAIEPFLFSYWSTAKTLLQIGEREPDAVDMKQLGKMSQSFLRQLLESHMPKHYGCLSLDTLNNAAMGLIKSSLVSKVKLNNGAYGLIVKDKSSLKSVIDRLERYLPLGSSTGNDKASDPKGVVDYSQLLNLKSKL